MGASILLGIISALGLIVPAFLTFRVALLKEKKKIDVLTIENQQYEIKISFFNKILDITSINVIKNCVDRIFESTKADRFLILIAINGKIDFNVISVIFEQYQGADYKVNAIARYHNIKIDGHYRKMLKQSEREDVVELEVSKMPNCMLKDIFELERVSHSLIRHLIRKPINKDNDFLVYSELSSHGDKKFTRLERTFIKTQYEGTIIPNIQNVLN